MRYERNKKPPPRLVSVTPRSWIRKLVPDVGASGPDSPKVARLADVQFRVQGAEHWATEIRDINSSLFSMNCSEKIDCSISLNRITVCNDRWECDDDPNC
jgi:hypothetical protein